MSNGPDLRLVRYFVAVADELHFGRAAARLFIAPPTLSRQIAQLEADLGVSLLVRTTRRVTLTAAGEVLLEHGRALLDAAERAWDLTRQAGGVPPLGRVSLVYTPAAGYEQVPRLLSAMRDSHPEIEVTAVEMWGPYLLAAVARGDYDVGLASAPERSSVLAYRPFAEEALAVVVPDGHPLSRLDRVPVAALAGHRLLLWPRELAPGFHDLVVGMCRTAGFEPTIARFQHVGGRDLTEFAAGLGIGVSVASNSIVDPAGIAWRPLADAPRLSFQLCWRDEPAAPAQTLIDTATALADATGR